MKWNKIKQPQQNDDDDAENKEVAAAEAEVENVSMRDDRKEEECIWRRNE